MKTTNRIVTFSAAALAFASLCAHSLAQDEKPAQANAAASVAPPEPNLPVWSMPEFENAAKSLTGSWKATASLPDGTTTDVVISIAPVGITGLTDVLYVESARADGLNRPYRTAFWRFVKSGDGVKLQSLEFRRPRAEMACINGLWAAPESFPLYTADDVVATAEMSLKGSGASWAGQTPVPVPTIMGGATHMTSEIAFDGATIQTADRGLNASGQQVWGPAAGEKYTFTRFDTGVTTKKWPETGLLVIDYPAALSGEPAKQGDIVSLNYVGYLTNGEVFDSSYERNAPFTYAFGTPLIAGWNTAMEQIQPGMKRRLVIPGPLGYGAAGRRPKIPSNATLIFDIDVLKIESAPPPAQQPEIESKGAEVKPVDGPPPEVRKKMEEEIARKMKERAEKEAAEKAANPK